MEHKGLYKLFIKSSALSLSSPTTILSGFKKSSIAAPSFRNSGFEATSNSILTFAYLVLLVMLFFTFREVPTGTVLLTLADNL
jgi:hypothetical protein